MGEYGEWLSAISSAISPKSHLFAILKSFSAPKNAYYM